ncbi:MAG: RsmD family RNA methyltransferase [Chloroflexi bacterium]|nr:RsmD family RNA methyltransferase [Chloroflexota bacterium]
MIGGSARGVELRAPKGGGTRPTTGRLREALFSMLESAEASFDEVLDLYAGSGALGIEALSRGGGRATFVEADRRATALIRENLTRVRLSDRATVVTGRVGRWRPPSGARYTLVLADPPYEAASGAAATGAAVPAAYHGAAPSERTASGGGGSTVRVWQAIDATVQDCLAEDAVLVVEHNARRPAPSSLAGLPLWRDRRQGTGAVAIYREARFGVDDAGDESEELSGDSPELEGDDG